MKSVRPGNRATPWALDVSAVFDGNGPTAAVRMGLRKTALEILSMLRRTERTEPRSSPTPKFFRSAGAMEQAKRKFLRVFPRGFRDETYLAWERNYKWEAHQEWEEHLSASALKTKLRAGAYQDIAARAVKIESGRSLLFSFEKMALRDAVRSDAGARRFAEGLYSFLHGGKSPEQRFSNWVATIEELPRKQTRVLTWPLVTVFGFIAQPDQHIFLKPNTTKKAARVIGVPFDYVSRPNWATYKAYLDLAATVRHEIREMRPRDMIDIQSFLWVQGSDEYR